MKKLLVYLKGYERESVLSPLFKMLEAFWDLLVPLVVAKIIDVGIARGDKGYIARQFLVLLALALIGLSCSVAAQFFAAKASVGFAAKLRQALFDHVQALSFTELDTLGTDTLITRMTSDVQQVQNGLNMALRLLLRSPFIVFGSLVMAFTIDVRCALIFAAAIPLLGAVVYGIMIVSIPLFSKVQSALDAVTGKTRENLTGVRVIRAFCKEEQQIRQFDECNARLTAQSEKVGRISALMNPVTYVMINIATILLIYQGGLRVDAGAIGQGSVVALYNYMAQMIVELIKLASLIITINKALACAERVEKVLEVEPGMIYEDAMDSPMDGRCGQAAQKSGESVQSEQAVRFRDVSFTYEGAGEEALSHLDFSVDRGQTLGIIGGTGSGKSTLVNLIPRFYDSSRGEVEVMGRNVRDYAKGELTDLVGMVPQRAVLFAGSIRDNLLWGNEYASEDQLWEALTLAQAREIVEGKDGGLDFMLEQNGRNLSGGQRQRLTIARALVKRPRLLIMDDSASALDYATDAALRRAVRSLAGQMTTVIVSQRTSSVRGADLILVLDDGRLVGKGTHEQLMGSSEIYQEIYYSQFPEERSAQKREVSS